MAGDEALYLAVDIGRLVAEAKEAIPFDALSNKKIAIDAYNTIYQFLSIIRQPDGTPLVDSKNRVTSHLSGLFYRAINLLEYNITPIFVFDGIPSALKQRTIQARISRRKEALEEWNKAKEKGFIEEARTYAMASTTINKEIVESSKELLRYMGIACMQAPGEAEAQAAHMTKEKLVYATASQDYDSFLFGSETVIRNFTITGKRKLPRKNVYVNVELERIYLRSLLDKLQINQKQLIMLGILIGTDFNEGIEGIGPKTALKIVRERKHIDDVIKYVEEKYNKEFDVDPHEVEDIFLEPDVKEVDRDQFSSLLSGLKPDLDKIVSFMCDEHGFSEERIEKFAQKIISAYNKAGQKDINSWIK